MNIWLILFVVVLIELAREAWIVWGVSRQAEQLADRGDVAGACAIYEKQTTQAAPLLGLVHPFRAHYRLGQLYTLAQRYEDSARHWQILLDGSMPHAGVASDIRQRLADCLEGMGRDREAHEQRDLAWQSNGTGRSADLVSLLAQADALEVERRFAGAVDALERALPLATGIFKEQRTHVLLKLSNALWNAGRIAPALDCAQQALQTKPQGMMLALAHKMIGLCLSTQGDLDGCESHRAAALEILTQLGHDAERMQAAGELAEVIAKRGQIDDAMKMIDEYAPRNAPLPLGLAVVRHMCLMARGDFDGARRVLEEMRDHIPFVPHLARRLNAAISMDMARGEAMAGRGAQAWPVLCSAESEMTREPRLGLRFQGAQAWLLALRGDHEAARFTSDGAEISLRSFADDWETVRIVRGDLSRAAFARGDFAGARDGWQKYLDAQPAPIYLSMISFHLGEAHEALGDIAAARAAYDKSANGGIETYSARRARERLAAIGAK